LSLLALFIVREIKFENCHVEWHGRDDVYFYQQKSPSKFYTAISNALHFTKSSGFYLQRRYIIIIIILDF